MRTKVKDLLSSEDRWTQRVSARDSTGQSVMYDDASACKWCLLGAICYCYPGITWKPIEMKVWDLLFGHLLKDGRKRRLGDCLSVWNDSPDRCFEDVRALVLKAGI